MEQKAVRFPELKYVCYTAIVSVGMTLAVFAALRIWPFGGSTFLTGDLGEQYLQFFSHFKRALAGDASFGYGFDKGLGGGLVALWAYYCGSPLNLLFFLTPVAWFPAVAGFVWGLKVALACSFMRLWLGRKFPGTGWGGIALALGYGYMSFMFAYGQHIMWMDAVLLLPLVCLGVDRLVEGRGFGLYTVCMALALWANFYTGFMVCLFTLLYFVYSMLLCPAEPGLRGFTARFASWRRPLLRFGVGSLLALGMCAALLLPARAAMGASDAAETAALAPLFDWQRLPERFAWGSFAPGELNEHLPFVYCGILAMLLALALFLGRAVALREKLLSGGVLLLLLLSFWLQGPNSFWHGMQALQQFPARYAFVFCLFVIMLAAKSLHRRDSLSHAIPLAGGVLVVVFLFMAVFPQAVSRSRILLTALAAGFFTFCLLLVLFARSRRQRVLFTVVILFVTAVELTANGYYISRQFAHLPMKEYTEFVQQAGGTVQAIRQADNGDYRVAENTFQSLNDAMLLNYRGIAHVSSSMDGRARQFLDNMGYRAYAGAGPYLGGNTAFADGVLGLRYLLDGGAHVPGHWQQAEVEAPLPVYENPYAMPFAFAAGPQVAPKSQGALAGDMFGFQNYVYAALGGEGSLFYSAEEVYLRTREGDNQALSAKVKPGGYYELVTQQPGWYYAWIDCSSVDLPMLVNGAQRGTYFTVENHGVIDLGYQQASQIVTLQWQNEADIPVTATRFVYMDQEALAAMVQAVRQNAADITMEDGLVQGTVHAPNAGMYLFTSIPWEAGWYAELNGEAVEPQALLDGVLTLPLAQGDNSFILRYTPPGSSWVGPVLSLLCLALFAVYLGLGFWRQLAARQAKVLMDEAGQMDAAEQEMAENKVEEPPGPDA